MPEQLMLSLLKSKVNAFRVAVFRDGRVDLREMLPVSVCQNAYSISKNVTATAVGMLVSRGELSLLDTLDSFFDLKAYDSALRRIQIRHLLTHTMGAATGYLFEADRDALPTADWLDYILRQPLAYAPGEHFAYSNASYYLLSRVVECACGQTLADFCRENLFYPLGTGAFAWEACPEGHTMGATGLYVSAKALALLGALYLKGGTYEGQYYFSADWADQAHAPVPEVNAGDYCLGFYRLQETNGDFCGRGAHGQLLYVCPAKELVAVVQGYDESKGLTRLVQDWVYGQSSALL